MSTVTDSSRHGHYAAFDVVWKGEVETQNWKFSACLMYKVVKKDMAASIFAFLFCEYFCQMFHEIKNN